MKADSSEQVARVVPLQRIDYISIGVLVALAAFIWLRDLAWVSTSDDTLPILVSMPLFIWLGMPWKLRQVPIPFSKGKIVVSVLFFLAGIITNLTFMFAVGWTLLLWTYLYSRMDPKTHSAIRKLLILPIMAFPWVALDAETIGWWFRLSGAQVTSTLFASVGFNVQHEGTLLFINKLPVSVEVACAGLNNLQSMLIAGTVVNFLLLGETVRYWFNIPLLFIMAWVANTLRIIVLTTAALAVSPEFALGSFHTWGGWFILIVMFGMCWLFLSLQEPKHDTE